MSTDANGSYQLILDSPPKGDLIVNKPGYAEYLGTLSFQDSAYSRRDFVLEEAKSAIRGRITDLQGTPIEGAVVCTSIMRSFRSETGQILSAPLIVKTDSRGEYEIREVVDGKCWVTASHEEYKENSTFVDMQSGEVKTVDLSLSKAKVRFMKVRVVDSSGVAIQSAWIDGACRTSIDTLSTPDVKGVQRIRLDFEGSTPQLECRVGAPGYLTRAIPINPDLNQPKIEIVLEKAELLTGTVTGPDGNWIEGAKVYFRDDGRFSQTFQTDGFGSFSISIADPPARYIRVSKPGYADRDLTLEPSLISRPLKITLNLAEKPPEVGGGVYGRVFESSGTPSYAFAIHIVPMDEGDAGVRIRSFINLDGEFMINDLPEGKYSLFARRQNDGRPDVSDNPCIIEFRKGIVKGPIVLKIHESVMK
ncbi:MAG: carboxypeptidase-like regulatory domain-containing protein [Acidobacteriia bacterium]|nr:carboxypeptidase-like regulatory domain-containing protein [Terriglobia bacterium]